RGTAALMPRTSALRALKPETARRLRGRREPILGWDGLNGYRAADNPARWKGHLQPLLPAKGKLRAVKHHAAVPYAELPPFMVELRQQPGVAARALEFAILTAARTSEVIHATASEFDLAAKVWSISAGRINSIPQHRIPLPHP